MIRKDICVLLFLAALFVSACQDHHFTPYDKMEPVEEPKPGGDRVIDLTGGAPSAASSAKTTPYGDMASAPKSTFQGLIASGTVDVSPEFTDKLNPDWTLYVIARPAAGGPAIAAKRGNKVTFPYTFEMTEKDIMMGDPQAGMPITVEARFDSDGDPITKAPQDLFGKTQTPVDTGAKGVNVVMGAQPPVAEPKKDVMGK